MSELLHLIGKVRIHSLTLILLLIGLLSARIYEILILFLIVLVHELGHALVAHHYKWPIIRMRLYPFGGELETNVFGQRPWKEEFLVVLAGPFQHILLFTVAWIIHQLGWFTGAYYTLFLQINWMVFCVNLLPILPLDGGKLLFLLIARVRPFLFAHIWTIRSSFLFLVCLILLVALFAPTHVNSWLLISFLLFSIWKEWRQYRFSFIRFLLNKQSDEEKMKRLVVSKDTKVMDVLTRFHKNHWHEIVVIGAEEGIVALTEEDLLHECFVAKKPFTKMAELIHENIL